MGAVPRFAELLRVLHDHGVEFVVVGGVAAVLEGAPLSTFDLDIVPRWSPENLDRLAAALQSLEALYSDPAGRHIESTRQRLESPGHHLLETRLGPLDVLGTIGRSRRFENFENSTVTYELDGRSYRVLDLDTQIAVKREAGREKDEAALPLLERTREKRR